MAIRRTLYNALAAAMATTNNYSKVSTCMVQELKLLCTDGTVLAAQQWHPTTSSSFGQASSLLSKNQNNNEKNKNDDNTKHDRGRTILCLHGWMDNCRSFYRLAPALVAAAGATENCSIHYNVIALDFPGHGHSSHKSIDAPPMVATELAYYVSEAIHALNNEKNVDSDNNNENHKITLVGHSLGAAIASLYTAAFPEQVDQLILLDGAGFVARDAKDTPLHVRNHITRRTNYQQQQQGKLPRTYPSLEMAIQTRLLSIKKMPGNQFMAYETAKELVQRGVRVLPNDEHNDGPPKVQFRHDSRFAWPSIQFMTWEQNEGIFAALGQDNNTSNNTDCCILIAGQGWPFPKHITERTVELIRPRVFQTLPGSHYFHVDPDTSDAVTEAVIKFLRSKDTTTPAEPL